MSNKEKFDEVFGKNASDVIIKKMCTEELSVTDVILWFYEDYFTEEAPKKKRDGRPKKVVG